MKYNEFTAVSTPQVLLVPYDHRHVLKYHAWMEDPAIQEATASERLTVEEEYENQESWRASHDKLTFIICQPLSTDATSTSPPSVTAGVVDAPEKMVGDINFFLYPDDDEVDETADVPPSDTGAPSPRLCIGEVDIMIAEPQDRGRGLGKATVSAFLHYILKNIAGILQEYQLDAETGQNGTCSQRPLKLKMLMAKIKAHNAASRALFTRLDFQQEGDVNYFGEVKLTYHDLARLTKDVPEGYAEIVYSRPGEK
ncbi:hypothetical protein GQ53DRAFT_749914 [Thozetella sp. PMI_491]|nr:hypothetical protein GQ53DRAFT_749914 [Thozetella sp. PMI_491]